MMLTIYHFNSDSINVTLWHDFRHIVVTATKQNYTLLYQDCIAALLSAVLLRSNQYQINYQQIKYFGQA